MSHAAMSPAAVLHPHPGGPPPPPPHGPNNFGGNRPPSHQDFITQGVMQTWLQFATTAEKMGNNQLAIESYHAVLKWDKWNVPALRGVASILRAEDKFDQAVEYIRSILSTQPADGESWSCLGHCYLMMDELQQAYSAYQSALYNLTDPKEPKLWYGIGILYDRYGSLDHAEEAFSQVMRMAPGFEKANEIYFRLGIIYKQQLKYDQSLDCFRYIVANPPSPLNQTDIWFQIGHVYEQQKKYDNAKQAYIKVLERDPKHAKVLQQLGWLHHQQSADYQSQESAIEYLEQSVSSDQTDAQSWYLLGRCYMSQHKFPKAYEAYQQAVYRDGRNPTFWCSIGVLYYQINQYRDALDAYSRAIRLNPNISEVWYDLGTLYESCNNQTTDAMDAYQRAAELDPTNQAIKNRLTLLKNGQSTNHLNQNGGPVPQDMPPQSYQPTTATGPAQAPWGGHQSHQNQHLGPAPPPLQGRDWGRPTNEQHNAPPPPPPPPASAQQAQASTPMNHLEQRDSSRLQSGIPQRHPSPKPASYRHHDPYSQAARQPPSLSPRSRPAVVDLRRYAPGVPTPASHQPQHPHHQSIPSRISNPNYGGQHLPPTPSAPPAPSIHPSHPPYSRPATPPGAQRQLYDSGPLSPRSAYQHAPPSSLPHHTDLAGQSNIMSGAPAPSSALQAAEAAARDREREREREQREREERAQQQVHKRPREWESREDLQDNNHKKNGSDEVRARLDEPHASRATPFGPMEHERQDQRDKPAFAGQQSLLASPDAMRRANENYRPSAVAHQPAPLSTVLYQESRDNERETQQTPLPSMNAAPLNGPSSELAPINVPPKNEAVADTATNGAPQPIEIDDLPEKKDADQDRMDVDVPEKAEVPAPKRPEEPAARKMEVDENYDDESADEGKEAAASVLTATTEVMPSETNGVAATITAEV